MSGCILKICAGKARKLTRGLEVYNTLKKCLFSSIASDLRSRDLVSFDSMTPSDIQTLLWIALDLKEKKTSKIHTGSSVFMISDDPIRRMSLSHAVSCLGASVAFGDGCGDQAAKHLDLSLFGKTLASAADIVFLDSQKLTYEESELIATGCTVPVVAVSHADLRPVICLAELMTLYEKYQYLRRLIVSYVGQGDDPTLNTYAVLLPKVGMHLRYLVSNSINSNVWEKAVKLATQHNTEFQQKDSLEEVVNRTHVLSTCPQSEWKLDIKDTKEMDLEWALLHKDIYKGTPVTEDMLRSTHCLIWNSLGNLTWIFQAIIISFTKGYKPTIPRPDFEGIP